MTWAASIIAEFGRSIGIDNLSPSHEGGGAVQMTFGTDGLLCLEPTEDHLLVYLAREIPEHDLEIKVRAMKAIGPERQWAWPVQVGTRGRDRLLFLVRLPRTDATLTALEQALDMLVRLHLESRDG